MLNVRTLPPLAPGARMIFIGDIHGCSEEFDAIVKKLGYQKGHDVLILVGDLVNKGYDSVGVVERAIDYGAIGVLGNHDASLISRYDRIREGEIDPSVAPHTLDPMTQTAAILSRKCYKYLTDLSHILMIPQFDVIVAHAGLNPKTPLAEQNLWELLHMRRILPNGRVIDAQSGGDLWATKWKGPQTVIFGHDARTGLQLHPFAIGLDTGCCYGGDLTAYVLPGKQFVKIPGSKRGVSKKPPTASPETQIGFSPSTEYGATPAPPVAGSSVVEKLMAAAPTAVTSGQGNNATNNGSRQTPSTIPSSTNLEKTEALKNMLFGKNPSPVPPAGAHSDGPTFPSVPPSSVGTSTTHSPFPEGGRHPAPPLPRSAAGANNTAPSPVPLPQSLLKLVPSTQVGGSTVERSVKKDATPTPNPTPIATPSQPAAPPQPAQSKPAVAPVVTTPTPVAQQLAPVAAKPSPATTAAVVAANATANTALITLRRHLLTSASQVAQSITGSSGAIAGAVIEILCGGPMEDHRQELLDDASISTETWVQLITGISRHVTDPKCVGFVADETLLWIQDIASNKPAVLESLDRKSLEASIMLTTVATKTVVKSTLIAVRK